MIVTTLMTGKVRLDKYQHVNSKHEYSKWQTHYIQVASNALLFYFENVIINEM